MPTSSVRQTPLFLKSLEGLEKAIPPEGYSTPSPSTPSWKFDKPLPKIPRATSSLYSVDSRFADLSTGNHISRGKDLMPAATRSCPGFPADNLSNSLYIPQEETLRPLTFTNIQCSSMYSLQDQSPPSLVSTPGTCCDYESISLGPYASEREWILQLETKRALELQRPYFISRTEPNTPSTPTAGESFDPIFISRPLEFQGYEDELNQSQMSLPAVRYGDPENYQYQKPQPVLRRVMSEERPPRYPKGKGHISWATPKNDRPVLTLAQETRLMTDEDSPSTSPHLTQGHTGNRTELFSFSSSTSQHESDSNSAKEKELPRSPRPRKRHPAVQQTNYQKHGSKVFIDPKYKPSLTLPRCIKRFLPETDHERRPRAQTKTSEKPIRPYTPSPLGTNRTPIFSSTNLWESRYKWRSTMNLTREKIGVPKNLDGHCRRGKEKMKNGFASLKSSSGREKDPKKGERWVGNLF